MTTLSKSIFLFLITILLTSCFTRKNIPGPYYIGYSDGSWDLNYDLGSSGGIGRVGNVSEVGWTERFIFVISEEEYYWLDKRKDMKYYNYDDIVNGPLTKDQFSTLLDSLEIRDFSFQLEF